MTSDNDAVRKANKKRETKPTRITTKLRNWNLSAIIAKTNEAVSHKDEDVDEGGEEGAADISGSRNE